MNLTLQNCNIMKKVASLIFFLIISLGIYGQRVDYYLSDSTTIIGAKIIDAGEKENSQFVSIKRRKDIVIKLSPDEVQEYGFADKRVYVSKEIHIDDTTKRVFLEKLTDGKISLYYYRGKSKLFVMEKDSSFLIAMPKNKGNDNSAYKVQLKEITGDCPEVADAANFVGYNKKSLIHFFDRYNKCKLRPFPHFRYGIKAGYEWTKIIDPPQSFEQFDFKYGGSFTLGLFMDAPINVSDFSLNLGINYSRHGYSYNKLIQVKDFDFVANLSSLKMPVLVRYALPSNKYRFFVQTGGIIEYNLKKDAHWYESSIEGNIITIERIATFKIDDSRFGFSVGAGMEYKVTTRNSLFFELSFDQLYGDMYNRNILLIIGLNL